VGSEIKRAATRNLRYSRGVSLKNSQLSRLIFAVEVSGG